MWFTIRHRTVYRYSASVRLAPHRFRFRPRDDGSQRVTDYRLQIAPPPAGRNDHLDRESNLVTQAWFEAATDRLELDASMRVETLRADPFAFILAPEALQLPIASTGDRSGVDSYLERASVEEPVRALANGLRATARGDSLDFLRRLNEFLFGHIEHEARDRGAPRRPSHTLAAGRGACRDLAVLFIDCCRVAGIPARFASGYQKGDGARARRQLHAWPEVYLPGAGWRGYDPTHGTAVADEHVTVAAASHPERTMPVSGSYGGRPASSSLRFSIEIEVSEEGPSAGETVTPDREPSP